MNIQKKSASNKNQPANNQADRPLVSAVPSAKAAVEAMESGQEKVRDFVATGQKEARKVQEKAFSFGQDAMSKVSEFADKAANTVTETIATGKEQMDALMESSKIATNLGKELQSALVEDMNELFADNVALSKELLACRTVHDLVDIQTRAVQSHFARLVDNAARVSQAWFRLATEAAEPVATQATQAASRVNKVLAA